MNWKFTAPMVPVRFDVGEPLFQAVPLATNLCRDLESASVIYMRLADDPVVADTYREWNEGRRRFHEQKAGGTGKADGWQKDYFSGRDAFGRNAAPEHVTKVAEPKVAYRHQKSLDAVDSEDLTL